MSTNVTYFRFINVKRKEKAKANCKYLMQHFIGEKLYFRRAIVDIIMSSTVIEFLRDHCQKACRI